MITNKTLYSYTCIDFLALNLLFPNVLPPTQKSLYGIKMHIFKNLCLKLDLEISFVHIPHRMLFMQYTFEHLF